METNEEKKVNTVTVVTNFDNCIDCSEHSIQPDPDPHDWFCDDDVKVICMKENKEITGACRPYRTRHECKIPDWCPLLKK